ncbi:hypothetical protein [Lactonifactor longoviformis]|uniref:hypothetical protein n=1 Tax=Lactonifactor longoviformis TaxID=341220 RepID=UPI0036F203A7
MNVEQFVIAYGVEQDRLRAIMPEGFVSLRPVLRINVEIRNNGTETVYVELNTAVEIDSKRGWLNIGNWNSTNTDISYVRNGKAITFTMPFLEVTYTGIGMIGGCPAEKDNEGCFFLDESVIFKPAEKIESNKEFCDCVFSWKFAGDNAHGASIGKTLPAFATEPKKIYDKQEFTVQNAVSIPCEQVLGSYFVEFKR